MLGEPPFNHSRKNESYYAGNTCEMPNPLTAASRPDDQDAGLEASYGAASSDALRRAVGDKDAAMASNDARREELHAHHQDWNFWRIYRTFCQIRFGYFSFLVLMALLMFSFTLLMEIFFVIFLPSARTYSVEYFVRSILLLAVLPVVLFLLSYFFEEGVRFFFDAINKTDGGQPNFRLALAVVVHYIRHRKEIKEAEQDDTIVTSTEPDIPRISTVTTRSSMLFLSAKEDPYTDVDKDDEDDEWIAAETQRRALVVSEEDSTEDEGVEAKPARSRWKKATTAVKVAVFLNKVHDDGTNIDFSTFVFVDFLFPVVFEIVTILLLVFEFLDSWSPYDAFLLYVRAGFWIMGAYLLLWVVTHFWSSRNRYMRLMITKYRRKRRIMRREMNRLQREKQEHDFWLLDVGFRFYHHVSGYLNPIGWCWRRNQAAQHDGNHPQEDALPSSYDTVTIDVTNNPTAAPEGRNLQKGTSFADRMNYIRSTHARIRAKNPWHKLSYNRQAIILLIATIVAALISLASLMVGWPIMGVCMILLSNVIQRRFPQIFGATFRHFITTFVVLSFIFFSSTIIIGTFVTGGSFALGPFPTDAAGTAAELSVKSTGNGLSVPKSLSAEYPVCSIDYDGLNVLDLALIADAAYGSTPDIQKVALANRFNGTELQDMDFVAHNADSDHQVWMELYFQEINMTVIGVRGTASAADALEDLHFWFGISIMQAINVFVPFLKQLPRAFVVALLSMRSFTFVMPDPVYTPVLKHVMSVAERVGKENVVVTGHSLGGAIAAVIGAKTKTRAVSFSGPGLIYSRGRFDIEERDIRDYVLTIKPQKDIVPQVDRLGGMVQEIRCWEKDPMSCHSTNTHMCELQASCGDARGRNWATNEVCQRYRTLIKLDEEED